jgi:hypothetical protein
VGVVEKILGKIDNPFFLGGEISSLGEDFFHFSLVPNMFPSSFHQVP